MYLLRKTDMHLQTNWYTRYIKRLRCTKDLQYNQSNNVNVTRINKSIRREKKFSLDLSKLLSSNFEIDTADETFPHSGE